MVARAMEIRLDYAWEITDVKREVAMCLKGRGALRRAMNDESGSNQERKAHHVLPLRKPRAWTRQDRSNHSLYLYDIYLVSYFCYCKTVSLFTEELWLPVKRSRRTKLSSLFRIASCYTDRMDKFRTRPT